MNVLSHGSANNNAALVLSSSLKFKPIDALHLVKQTYFIQCNLEKMKPQKETEGLGYLCQSYLFMTPLFFFWLIVNFLC